MNFLKWLSVFWLVLAMPATAHARSPDEIATKILGPLLDPGRIATLKGDRPINTRLYRILGWLETARLAGGSVDKVIIAAQRTNGAIDAPCSLEDRTALRRSWEELERFGCFTPKGIETLKKGGSPKITRGEHAGDIIHLDHILPRSVVPEFDSRFLNLIPVPSTVNLRRGSCITSKELALARRWHRQGLLSDEGLTAIQRVIGKRRSMPSRKQLL